MFHQIGTSSELIGLLACKQQQHKPSNSIAAHIARSHSTSFPSLLLHIGSAWRVSLSKIGRRVVCLRLINPLHSNTNLPNHLFRARRRLLQRPSISCRNIVSIVLAVRSVFHLQICQHCNQRLSWICSTYAYARNRNFTGLLDIHDR